MFGGNVWGMYTGRFSGDLSVERLIAWSGNVRQGFSGQKIFRAIVQGKCLRYNCLEGCLGYPLRVFPGHMSGKNVKGCVCEGLPGDMSTGN